MITDKQLKARRKGLGGSDIQHLMNVEPFGCIRYLWYDKRGFEPDYPILSEGAILRGNKLEKIIVDEYKLETGHKVKNVDRKTFKSKEFKWAMAHLDGEVVGASQGPGVLECKSVGRNTYKYIEQEGLPLSWILQMQHGMFVSHYEWASIAVLWAEQWKFITFNIERDEEIIAEIKSAGDSFWRSVENGPAPDRLDSSDKRCGRCPYRTTCQGEYLMSTVQESDDVEFDDSISPLVIELSELESKQAETNTLILQAKNTIKDLIGDRAVVDCAGYRLHYKPIETKRINSKKLKAEQPELYNKYVSVSVSRPFKKTKR